MCYVLLLLSHEQLIKLQCLNLKIDSNWLKYIYSLWLNSISSSSLLDKLLIVSFYKEVGIFAENLMCLPLKHSQKKTKRFISYFSRRLIKNYMFQIKPKFKEPQLILGSIVYIALFSTTERKRNLMHKWMNLVPLCGCY